MIDMEDINYSRLSPLLFCSYSCHWTSSFLLADIQSESLIYLSLRAGFIKKKNTTLLRLNVWHASPPLTA